MSNAAKEYVLGSSIIGDEGAAMPETPEVLGATTVSDWDKSQAYSSGSTVRYWGKYYKAQNDVSSPWFMGNDTPDSSSDWKEVTSADVIYGEIPLEALGVDMPKVDPSKWSNTKKAIVVTGGTGVVLGLLLALRGLFGRRRR